MPSDQYLTSPVMHVASTGSFSFTFQHRHSFEFDQNGYFWDGGVIELSDDGGATWIDIGYGSSPPYNGGFVGTSNPLDGRRAYVARTPGYPAFIPVTVDLGTRWQGQDVQVRFRVASDDIVGDAGWEIDNIVFQNITNLPFPLVVAHDPTCDADTDGTGDMTDCNPYDGQVWAPPTDPHDLLLPTNTGLSWFPPNTKGARSVLYDVLRSESAGDFLAAVCLESNDTNTMASDTVVPGSIFYYLVRAKNGCGSSMGTSSRGIPHAGRSCP